MRPLVVSPTRVTHACPARTSLVLVGILLLIACSARAQTLTVQPTAVTPGGSITVSFTGPTMAHNWVGLYPVGADHYGYLQWRYLNGLQTQPAAPVSNPVVVLTAPTTLGNYEVRLFTGPAIYTAALTVRAATTPVVGAAAVFNGDSITAPSNITGMNNWTAIVAARLGYTSFVNMAGNDKYAADVLNEVPSMSGQLCVVMIGTNDMVGSTLSDVPADAARAAYLSVMRNIVVGLKPRCAKVAIMSPPLSMSARETLRYPAVVDGLRQICVELGVTFLNLFQHMADLSAVSSEAVVSSWYSDWRHLTAAGHGVVADFVVQSGKLTP